MDTSSNELDIGRWHGVTVATLLVIGVRLDQLFEQLESIWRQAQRSLLEDQPQQTLGNGGKTTQVAT